MEGEGLNGFKGFQLDFRSGVPIYEQIVAHVRQQIESGALQPGDQLPTVRQLALELRVNFNTVARAYRLLDEAGLISTQQGRGTYILEQPPPERGERLRQRTLEEMTEDYLMGALRRGYDLEEIEQVFYRAAQRRREGQYELTDEQKGPMED